MEVLPRGLKQKATAVTRSINKKRCKVGWGVRGGGLLFSGRGSHHKGDIFTFI